MIEERNGSDDASLGACPGCDATVPSARLLIKYESEDGGLRMFAECPRCEVPIHPESKRVQRHANPDS